MKMNKSELLFLGAILVLLLILAAVARGQSIVASGGQFALEKQVVAGGGNAMNQAAMSQSGTGGQAVSEGRSLGGNFTLYHGFWTPDDFAPTAAGAVVAGTVRTADGRGIRNAVVTIAFPDGQTRTTVTGSLGRYFFAEIPVGSGYLISVRSKRFSFPSPTIVREVYDDISDADFVAGE